MSSFCSMAQVYIHLDTCSTILLYLECMWKSISGRSIIKTYLKRDAGIYAPGLA